MIHRIIEAVFKALLGAIIAELVSYVLTRLFSAGSERLTGLQPPLQC